MGSRQYANFTLDGTNFIHCTAIQTFSLLQEVFTEHFFLIPIKQCTGLKLEFFFKGRFDFLFQYPNGLIFLNLVPGLESRQQAIAHF